MIVRADLKYRFPENRRMAEDYSLWLDLAYHLGGIPKINQCLAMCDKNLFGDKGLSASLLKMEMNELAVIWNQYKENRIGICITFLLISYSISKYLIRLFRIIFRGL